MLEALNAAIATIEDALGDVDASVDAAELARIALTSEHHFRRMFVTLSGMPLAEYVRRRQLTVAGAAVVGSDEPLLDIAIRHGYASHEAFARAFKALHGIGPAEARRTRAPLVSQPPLSFRLVIEGRNTMRYRIVEKDAFRIVGSKARVPLVHSGPNEAIIAHHRGLDEQTRTTIAALSDQEPTGVVSVSDDLDPDRSEGSELDHWIAAVTSAEAPAGLASLEIPAGTWVVFSSDGPVPESLQALWRDAYAEWFPSQPWRTRPGPEILATEVYADGARARGELWLPVEAAD